MFFSLNLHISFRICRSNRFYSFNAFRAPQKRLRFFPRITRLFRSIFTKRLWFLLHKIGKKRQNRSPRFPPARCRDKSLNQSFGGGGGRGTVPRALRTGRRRKTTLNRHPALTLWRGINRNRASTSLARWRIGAGDLMNPTSQLLPNNPGGGWFGLPCYRWLGLVMVVRV